MKNWMQGTAKNSGFLWSYEISISSRQPDLVPDLVGGNIVHDKGDWS